jgi:putative membrane protein
MMSYKQINILIAILSIGVPLIIVSLLKSAPPSIEHTINLNFFPKLNATLNTGTSLCLIFGLFFIKTKRIKLHRISMLTALVLSCVFLVSYLFYHTFKIEDTKFGGEGAIRYVYYFILLTHIVLAAIILPFVLKTFSFALITKEFEKHKKWARWTYPFWLYVSITGVLIYIFLAPYY